MTEKNFLDSVSTSTGVFKTVVSKNTCFARIVDRSKPILLAFTNMGEAVSEEYFFSTEFIAWGDKISVANDLNIISFGCVASDNWYRSSELIAFIAELGKVICEFPERLGYGGSMGGFAIGSFAELLNLDRVLLLNPISTLRRELVPWETRFQEFACLDWSSKLFDGVNFKIPGIIVYDPIFSLDNKHAKRYGNNVKHLRCTGVGHAMPKHLIRIGVLKQLFSQFVRNEIDSSWFHRSVRRRKLYPHFYKWMLSSENIHLTSRRASIIIKHQRALSAYLEMPSKLDEESLVRVLRDAALKMEHVDKKLCLSLLEQILVLRPRAKRIMNKYQILKGVGSYEKN